MIVDICDCCFIGNCLEYSDEATKKRQTHLKPTRDDSQQTYVLPVFDEKQHKVISIELFCREQFIAAGTHKGLVAIFHRSGNGHPVSSTIVESRGVWSIAAHEQCLYFGVCLGMIFAYTYTQDMTLVPGLKIRTNSFVPIFGLKMWNGELWATQGEHIATIDLQKNKVKQHFKGHDNTIRRLTVAPSLDTPSALWSTGQDGLAIEWTPDGKKKRIIKAHKEGCLGCTTLGPTLFTVSSSWKVAATDIRNEERIKSGELHLAPIEDILSWGTLLYTISVDNQIRVWDAELECLRVLEGHRNAVTCAVMSSTGHLFTGDMDAIVKLWDCRAHLPVPPAGSEGVPANGHSGPPPVQEGAPTAAVARPARSASVPAHAVVVQGPVPYKALTSLPVARLVSEAPSMQGMEVHSNNLYCDPSMRDSAAADCPNGAPRAASEAPEVADAGGAANSSGTPEVAKTDASAKGSHPPEVAEAGAAAKTPGTPDVANADASTAGSDMPEVAEAGAATKGSGTPEVTGTDAYTTAFMAECAAMKTVDGPEMVDAEIPTKAVDPRAIALEVRVSDSDGLDTAEAVSQPAPTSPSALPATVESILATSPLGSDHAPEDDVCPSLQFSSKWS